MIKHPCQGPTAAITIEENGNAWSGRALLFWAALFSGLALSFAIDETVIAAVRPLHESRFADIINLTIRRLGTGQVQVILLSLMFCVGLCHLRTLRVTAVLGLFAFLASAAGATLLKIVIHRPRPWFEPPALMGWWASVQFSIAESKMRAFPSAESATTFAIAWLLACHFPRWRIPLVALASIVAMARVLVGAHHPSDIWAGAILGIAIALWMDGIGKKLAKKGHAFFAENVRGDEA